MMPRRRRPSDWEISPAELLEQAFTLLRALPMSVHTQSILGSVPFALALLFFWSDMSRSGTAALSVSAWALALALLYGWLKISQALFARGVWAQLMPARELPSLGAIEFFRRAAALIACSAFALPLQFIAFNLILPGAWVYASFHNTTVLAFTREGNRRGWRALAVEAAKLSHYEPLSHHLLLALLTVFTVLVWAGIYVSGLVLPQLWKSFTGVETVFTRNPQAAALNSLYLAVTVTLTWLVLSPFCRVIYVLRTFYALARPTGVDLLSRLHAVRRRARLSAALCLFSLACLSPAHAEESVVRESSPNASISISVSPDEAQSERLQSAIRDTLSSRVYQWRLPRESTAATEENESFLAAAFRKAAEALRSVFREVSRVIEKIFEKTFGDRSLPSGSSGTAGISGSAMRGVVCVLAGFLAAGILFVLIRLWLLRRREPTPSSVPLATTAPAPVDLSAEETLASELPEDQWLALARQQLAQGDTRLAVRALFLACLATLGEQRLIDIARTKSNRDYTDELARRALARRDLPVLFRESVTVFERVWYGWHEAPAVWVQQIMDNYEKLRRVPTS